MPCSCPSLTAKSQDLTAWLNRYGSDWVRAKSIARVTSGVSITVTPPRTFVLPSMIAGLAIGDIVLLSLDEAQQLRVDLILMRGGDPVRRAGVVNVLRALDEFRRLHGRVLHRYDLVVLTVQYQRRYIDLLEVLGEVGL